MAISHPRSSAGCVEMERGENSVRRLKPRVGGRSKDPPLRCDPDQNRTFAPARFRRNRQNASQRNKLDPYGFAGTEAITGRLLSRYSAIFGARQSLIAPSWLPDARMVPSWENATACTGA
jgi:hypothetical protein